MIIDPFIDVKEIAKELKSIEESSASLANTLTLLKQEVKYIISKIKSCESIEEAQEYFDILETIHNGLVRLLYVHKIGISDSKLDYFVYYFDRLFAQQEYKTYFQEIKSGKYTF